MKILAIDTTSNICSTALLEDDKLIDENTYKIIKDKLLRLLYKNAGEL